MKAEWGVDYDLHTDSCYSHPVCPKCKEPIWKRKDNKYHCFACGEAVEIQEDMIEWFKVREETKTEMEDCFPEEMGGCGGKKCMEVRYIRNPVTLEWQTAGGKCKCGMSFIV